MPVDIEISPNYFFDDKPAIMFKGNYAYAYNEDGSVYGVSMEELSNLIINHGILIEE